MKRALILGTLVAMVAGCHHNKKPTPDKDGPGMADPGPAKPPDTSADMVPAEKMDEIRRDLERKRETVSRCLAFAVDNKELPRNSKGKINLEIVITGGHASSVKVISTTLESQTLSDCVIKKVKEIEFPQLPKPYETSFNYQFEAI